MREASYLEMMVGYLEQPTIRLKKAACLWQGGNKPYHRWWERPAVAGMTQPHPASPRDDQWIQHHGKIDNGELGRSTVGEHCIGVAIIWARISRHRMRIQAHAKAEPDVAAEPIRQDNNAGCRGHRNRGDLVAAELAGYDSGMRALGDRTSACACREERFRQRVYHREGCP